MRDDTHRVLMLCAPTEHVKRGMQQHWQTVFPVLLA